MEDDNLTALNWSIDAVSSRWRRELCVSCGVSRTLVGRSRVTTIPSHRHELLLDPLRLHRSTTPLISQIIQHVDQAALHSDPMTLHDVQIGIGMKDSGLTAREAMMRVDQCVDSIRCAGPGKFTIEIVPPEDARISVSTRMNEYPSILSFTTSFPPMS